MARIIGVRLVARRVLDLAASHAFFTALGLEVANQRQGEIIRYAMAGGSHFEIIQADPVGMLPDEAPDVVLLFETDDLDGILERATAAGARLVAGPVSLRVLRAAWVRDPFGALMGFAELLTPPGADVDVDGQLPLVST